MTPLEKQLATDAKTSPEVLAELATHLDHVVRRLVAANPNTQLEVLYSLANFDFDLTVLASVRARASALGDLVLAATADSSVEAVEAELKKLRKKKTPN